MLNFYPCVVKINDFPLFLILFKQSHNVLLVFGSIPLYFFYKIKIYLLKKNK